MSNVQDANNLLMFTCLLKLAWTYYLKRIFDFKKIRSANTLGFLPEHAVFSRLDGPWVKGRTWLTLVWIRLTDTSGFLPSSSFYSSEMPKSCYMVCMDKSLIRSTNSLGVLPLQNLFVQKDLSSDCFGFNKIKDHFRTSALAKSSVKNTCLWLEWVKKHVGTPAKADI